MGNNEVWQSGLVIGLLVFGIIFFMITTVAAFIFCVRRKKQSMGFCCLKRLFNCGKKVNIMSESNSVSSDDANLFRIKNYDNHNSEQNSQDSNSTEISTISLSSAAVTSLQNEPAAKPKSTTIKRYPTLVLKSNAAADKKPDDAPTNETAANNGNQTDKRTTTYYVQSIDDIFAAVLEAGDNRGDSSSSGNAARPQLLQPQRRCSDVTNDSVEVDGHRNVVDANSPIVDEGASSPSDYDFEGIMRVKNKKDDDPTTQHLRRSFDEASADCLTVPDDENSVLSGSTASIAATEGITEKRTLRKMIRNTRGSFMPTDTLKKSMSVLNEEKWDSAIDLAFEDL